LIVELESSSRGLVLPNPRSGKRKSFYHLGQREWLDRVMSIGCFLEDSS
jgi:hypothetical protein